MVQLKSIGSCYTNPRECLRDTRSQSLMSTPSSKIYPSLTSQNLRIKDTIVDFPQPDSPTRATVSFCIIFKFKPLRIQSFLRVGQRNQTFLNSISPLKLEGWTTLFASCASMALISDGTSMIPNILLAACLAFPRSGPNYQACPAAIAPNIMENIEIKMCSEQVLTESGSKGLSSKQCFWKTAPMQQRVAKMKYWMN